MREPVGTSSRSLADRLVADIAGRQLQPGDLLPSERDLAAALGVGRTALRRGLRELADRGVIQREQGRGTFLAPLRDGAAAGLEPLMSGGSSLAILLPNTWSTVYRPMVHGFEGECRRHGRLPIIACSEGSVGVQADLLLRLVARDVEGVAIVPCSAPPGTVDEHLEAIRRGGMRVVVLNRPAPRPGIRSIDVRWSAVGEMAAECVVGAGHRRVALLINETQGPEDVIKRAFLARMEALGVPVAPGCVVCYPDLSETSQPNGVLVARLGALLSDIDPPTAVCAISDRLAEMAMLLLVGRGVRIPQDVSLLSFGSCHREGLMKRVSAVTIDTAAAGARAARVLLGMEESAAARELAWVPIGFAEGETLASPPEEESEPPLLATTLAD